MNLEQRNEALSFEPPKFLLDRFAQEHNVSKQDARKRFEETKKFLFLCATNQESSYTPSKEIDEMWHTFFLHSRDYFAFCDNLGIFVHHQPSSEPQTDNYKKTRQELKSLFGELNLIYWGEKAGDCESGNCDCPVV